MMTDLSLDRRQMLGAAVTVAALVPTIAGAQSVIAGGAATGPTYTPKPLPFDPKSITGLSEKMLTSHHDNNYTAAVKRLAGIGAELGKLDIATAPGFVINGLKREELFAQNSMFLHELYFSCIGAPSKAGAKLAAAIEKDFGSEAKWRAEFNAMGKALGGGSGWVRSEEHTSELQSPC